jgi:hypothetical protein
MCVAGNLASLRHLSLRWKQLLRGFVAQLESGESQITIITQYVSNQTFFLTAHVPRHSLAACKISMRAGGTARYWKRCASGAPEFVEGAAIAGGRKPRKPGQAPLRPAVPLNFSLINATFRAAKPPRRTSFATDSFVSRYRRSASMPAQQVSADTQAISATTPVARQKTSLPLPSGSSLRAPKGSSPYPSNGPSADPQLASPDNSITQFYLGASALMRNISCRSE